MRFYFATIKYQTCLLAGFILLSTNMSAIAKKSEVTMWQSDVIDVRYEHLEPSYWIEKLNTADNVLMSQKQIQTFNQDLLANNQYVVDPLAVEPSFSKTQLLKKINSVSSQPKSARYYADGRQLTDADFAKYFKNLNKVAVKESNLVQYGMVVSRAIMRAFPTHDRVFNKYMDTDLDRMQETGVFPGDTLAVLHESTDGLWVLAQHYHYLAWVPKQAIAIGDKSAIRAYKNADSFVVVTGGKVETNFVPNQPQVSEIQLDMGTRLPLLDHKKVGNQVYGQNPYASYVVELPIRNKNGSLAFKTALIARHHDMHLGYLPMTKRHIIQQAFKFLGERYGWGHDYNGRDCTGFVGEIYKSFGLVMPRNSGQQGAGKYGLNTRFSKADLAPIKMDAVKQLQVGDLIYIPGHVMMAIGDDDGKAYVIHDVKGLGYTQADGSFYKGTLNGVSVTPLLPLSLSKNKSYLDTVYNFKRIHQSQ
ncbi:SH3 domain-containing protein [Paraglaciecola aquimarina]|uniref:SH3 domain-containing protein n=1 Tax=Paraglaciecola algarum TaxID=3050085 RepID=A0ABS9D1J3_9ALTE|nr:SH3 domain-containing protein [Paraglaciecola sp. G1-23]MCF2946798.1 SH3 domain-containing protein [Paraglaciecola sp. G1-23]